MIEKYIYEEQSNFSFDYPNRALLDVVQVRRRIQTRLVQNIMAFISLRFVRGHTFRGTDFKSLVSTITNVKSLI